MLSGAKSRKFAFSIPIRQFASKQFNIVNAEKPHTGRLGPRVRGKLLTFDDPESRLPAIDRLEGFHPGEWSLYSRVLVPVHARERIVLAWLYIGGQQVEGRIVRTNISS